MIRMRMKRNEFFATLDSGLMQTEYTARLHEELEAHLDDHIYQTMLNGATEEDAEHDAIQRLGSPYHIKKEYNTTMRKLKYPFVLFELFLYVTVLLPVNLTLLMNILMLLEVFGTWVSVITTCLSSGVLFFLYLTALQSIRRFVIKKVYLRIIGVLIAAPLCIIAVFFITMMLGEVLQNGFAESAEKYDAIKTLVLSLITLLGINVLAAFLAEKLIQRIQRRMLAAPLTHGQRKRYAKLVLEILVVGLFLLYIIVTRLQTSSLVTSQMLNFVDMPREVVEFFFLKVFWAIGTRFLPWAVAFWLQILILCTLLGFSLYTVYLYITRDRFSAQSHFPLFKMCLAIYLIGLLFLPTSWYEPTADWRRPASSLSLAIEKKQTGPFFRYFKSLNADDGEFTYRVGTNDKGLLEIEQSSGNRYTLSSLTSVEQYTLHKSSGEKTRNFMGEIDLTLPEGFECNKPESQVMNVYSCYSMRYHGTEIYRQREPNDIAGIAVSGDGRWILIAFSTGAYDPDFVYLVDVRELSSARAL